MKRVPTFLFLAIFVPLLMFANSTLKSFELVGTTKSGKPMSLNAKDLLEIGLKNFQMYDPYLERDVEYSGVYLKDFIDYFGDDGVEKVTIRAADGYVSEFSKGEWDAQRIVVVCKMNGKFIDPADYGPLKIVYPDYGKRRDDDGSIFIKWIWMIKEIKLAK